MSNPVSIAVVVGSLRKESVSRKAALMLAQLAPANVTLDIVEIGDLPLYNEDVEAAGAPESWTRFREQIAAHDAVLFVTPEYNRSVPGALKNAVDVGSRPYGKAVWNGKAAAVMSLSPGAIGGFGANHHLRQALSFFEMPVMTQPEAFIGNAFTLFDDSGEFVSDNSKAFFQLFIDRFVEFIERHQKAHA